MDENHEPFILNVYPNPFSEQTFLHLNKPLQDGRVRISDLSGRLLRSEVFSGTRLEIKKQQLLPGIYILTLLAGEKVIYRERLLVE